MIIQAYPNAFDATRLNELPVLGSRGTSLQHTVGSLIMTALMGLIALATYQRLSSMLAHQSQAGLLEYLSEIGTLCFA